MHERKDRPHVDKLARTLGGDEAAEGDVGSVTIIGSATSGGELALDALAGGIVHVNVQGTFLDYIGAYPLPHIKLGSNVVGEITLNRNASL